MQKISSNGIYFIALFLSSSICLAMELTQNTDSNNNNNNNSAAATYAARRGLPNTNDTRQQPTIAANANNTNQDIYILSIDGGGIRGIIPAQILSYIERHVEIGLESRIKRRIEEQLGHPLEGINIPIRGHLAKLFGLMAGVSTGGMIVLGLNVPHQIDSDIPAHSSSDLVNLYREHGEKVFPKSEQSSISFFSPKYSVQQFESLLLEYFWHSSLKDTIGKVLVTSLQMSTQESYEFATDKAKNSEAENFYIRDVVRAITAAQTYFPPAYIKSMNRIEYCFSDGGIIDNNASQDAYDKAKMLYPHARRIILLSLGTGMCQQDDLSKINHGIWGWGPILPHVMMYAASKKKDSKLVKEAETHPDKFKYIRVQSDVPKEHSALDVVDENHIKNLVRIAQKMILTHKKDLDDIVDGLADAYDNNPYPVYPWMTPFFQFIETQLLSKQGIKYDGQNQPELGIVGAWDLVTYFNMQPMEMREKLTALSLPRNSLGDDGLILLSRANLPSLVCLELQDNQLTSNCIAFLQRFRALKRLNISENNIGDEGARNITRYLPNLVNLNISQTELGIEGLNIVTSLRHLKRLNAVNNYKVNELLELFGSDDFNMIEGINLANEGDELDKFFKLYCAVDGTKLSVDQQKLFEELSPEGQRQIEQLLKKNQSKDQKSSK